jgi:hypothetical protein
LDILFANVERIIQAVDSATAGGYLTVAQNLQSASRMLSADSTKSQEKKV